MYISQDIIGLAGGNPTIYAYVHDPNSWVDVLGLTPKVFWSRGRKAQAAAREYVESIGREILEMTPQGKALEEFTEGMEWDKVKPLWEKTSQNFADSSPSSQKKAYAFIDSTRYRGSKSVWEQFEKPILDKKKIETEVIDINKSKVKCQ